MAELPSNADQYTLAFYVPTDHTTRCVEAIHKTGAGTWPNNKYCETCFIIPGTGQFRPLLGANPHTGKVGQLEKSQENKVEIIIFGRDVLLMAVNAMKKAHPYEVVAFSVVKNEEI